MLCRGEHQCLIQICHSARPLGFARPDRVAIAAQAIADHVGCGRALPKREPPNGRALARRDETPLLRYPPAWSSLGYSVLRREKCYQESSGSTNRADAVALLKKRIKEIGKARTVPTTKAKLTFASALHGVEVDYTINKQSCRTSSGGTSCI